jgi:hypothetical protein
MGTRLSVRIVYRCFENSIASVVLSCSVVCAGELGERLQVVCSSGCHVVPLSHFIVQDDFEDGDVNTSMSFR